MKIEPGSVEESKTSARADVYKAVKKKRLAYVSDYAGQDAVYSAKEAEALRYMADTSPDPAEYPFLAAEAGTTAATMADLASLWASKGSQWRQVASVIEGARMTVKAALADATTVTEVETAMQNFRNAMEQV